MSDASKLITTFAIIGALANQNEASKEPTAKAPFRMNNALITSKPRLIGRNIHLRVMHDGIDTCAIIVNQPLTDLNRLMRELGVRQRRNFSGTLEIVDGGSALFTIDSVTSVKAKPKKGS